MLSIFKSKTLYKIRNTTIVMKSRLYVLQYGHSRTNSFYQKVIVRLSGKRNIEYRIPYNLNNSYSIEV